MGTHAAKINLPITQTAMLQCSQCNKLTLHKFGIKDTQLLRYHGGTLEPLQDKDRIKAGKMLVHIFECTVCHYGRVWGNEMEPGKRPNVKRDYIKPRKVVNVPLNIRKGIHLDGNQ